MLGPCPAGLVVSQKTEREQAWGSILLCASCPLPALGQTSDGGIPTPPGRDRAPVTSLVGLNDHPRYPTCSGRLTITSACCFSDLLEEESRAEADEDGACSMPPRYMVHNGRCIRKRLST